MSIRQFRPMTAAHPLPVGVRVRRDHPRRRPEKSLLEPMKQTGGRNNQGHLTVAAPGRRPQAAVPEDRLQARTSSGFPGKVAEIEYDPNRSARIALIVYADGEKRYILHPKGLDAGRHGGLRARARTPGPATRCRSARSRWARRCTTSSSRSARAASWPAPPGSSAQVVAKEGDYVTLRLRSTEMRLVHGRCLATIGEVGNAEHELLSVGKAGKTPLAGQAAQGPRRRHEPGGPPAGRRRGQELGRPSADVALGQAGGQEDPAPEEGVHQAHRARTEAREGDT